MSDENSYPLRQRVQKKKSDATAGDFSAEAEANGAATRSEHAGQTDQKAESKTENARGNVSDVAQDLTPQIDDSRNEPTVKQEQNSVQSEPKSNAKKSRDSVSNLLFKRPSLEPKVDEKPQPGAARNEEYKPRKVSDSLAKKIAIQTARAAKQRSLAKGLFDRNDSYVQHVNQSSIDAKLAQDKVVERDTIDSSVQRNNANQGGEARSGTAPRESDRAASHEPDKRSRSEKIDRQKATPDRESERNVIDNPVARKDPGQSAETSGKAVPREPVVAEKAAPTGMPERLPIDTARSIFDEPPSDDTRALIRAGLDKDAHVILEPILKEHSASRELIELSIPAKDSLAVQAFRENQLEQKVDELMLRYKEQEPRSESANANLAQAIDARKVESPRQFVFDLPESTAQAVAKLEELEPEAIAFLHSRFSLDDKQEQPKAEQASQIANYKSVFGKSHEPHTSERDRRAREQLKLLVSDVERTTTHEQNRELLVYTKLERADAQEVPEQTRALATDALQNNEQYLAKRHRDRLSLKLAKDASENASRLEAGVVKQEQEIGKLIDDEPPPEGFCTIKCTRNWYSVRFWKARTIEEFDHNDPDIPASEEAIQAIVDVDRRWKLWRSRVEMNKEHVLVDKQLLQAEKSIEAYDRTQDLEPDDLDR